MKGMQKIISGLLVICLLLSMLPVQAFASENGAQPTESAVEMTDELTAPMEVITEPSEADLEFSNLSTIPTEETAVTVPEFTGAATEPEETAEPTQPEETVPETTEETMEETQIVEELPDIVLNANTQTSEDYSYTVLDDGTCEITKYSGTATELVVPGELDGYVVTKIGSNAFRGNSNLQKIEIPPLVTVLCSSAFSECTALTQITLPEGLTEIGEEAFEYCKSLPQITIPDSVTKIGYSAFRTCEALETIYLGDGLERIGGTAFGYCDALQSVVIPDSVTTIGTYVFDDCDSLQEVSLGNSLTAIPNYAFYNCEALTQITFSESVLTVGERAFSGCRALKQVTLNDGLEKIGKDAFTSCVSLQSIAIPDSVTSVYEYAFNGSGLTSVVLGGGITGLSPHMFDGCRKLVTIEIPDNVTGIGEYAFSGCSGLKEILMHDGLIGIGTRAFYECNALETVDIPATVTSIYSDAFFGCDALSEVILHEGLTTISGGAFSNCDALTAIAIPSTVTMLGTGAFNQCENLCSVELPEGLTEIGQRAFSGCKNLGKVLFPESLTTIGESAFSGCVGLEEIYFPDSVVSIGERAFSSCNFLKSVELPNQLTIIKDNVFYGCKLLEEVRLPNGLVTIGSSAFEQCENLCSIEFPESLTEIGQNAFKGCKNLESVVIPDSVVSVGTSAFSGCSNLKNIQLSANMTILTGSVLSRCGKLESIVIPEKVTVIGASAFYECKSLLSVKFPAGMQKINKSAFEHCESLTSVEIPNGITEIPNLCFFQCVSLKSVKLPDDLEVVGDCAFFGCPLQAVNLPSTLTTIMEKAFVGFSGDIIVPSTVTTIEDSAFTTKVVFYCDLCSAAAAYAVDNGIPIVERKNPNLAAISSLNRESSYFKATVDGIGASGNLSFTGQYEFKIGTNVADMYLQMNIPDHLQLQYNAMTLDGKKITDYDYGTNGVLKIPLANPSGVIRFQMRPMSYEKVVLYATMNFKDNGTAKSEILGTVYELLPVLTINATDETSSSQVTVSGITIPGNNVFLLVNGVEKAMATANKIGDYTATVDLGSVQHGNSYTITAKTSNGSSEVTAEKNVKFRTDVPVLEDLIISYNGQKVVLSELAAARPVLTFIPGSSFEYCVEVQNPELVETIFIVSRRGSEEKCVEAIWNAERQAFVVKGGFDPNNPSYVPGALTVEYVPKMQPVDYTSGFDYTSREKYNALPENWKNADVTVNANTANKTDLSFSIPELDGTTTSFRAVSERTGIPEGVTAENAEAMGYTKITDVSGITQFGQIATSGNEIKMTVLDFGNKTGITSLIKEIKSNKAPISAPEFLFKSGKMLGDYAKDLDSYHDMWSKIYNSDLDSDAQADMMGILGVGVLASTAATAFQAIALIGFTAVAVTSGLFAAGAMAAYGIASVVFGAAKWGIKRLVQRSLHAREMHHRKGHIPQIQIRWAIDPSGYVYNAETQSRIHGATVSVYWLPYDEADETYWDNKPAITVQGEMWDASEFSQLNPLITDLEGCYAWDVPEGWWRVKCEHPDYETTWSDWVPVPPPQTDVNIAMTPLGNRGSCGDEVRWTLKENGILIISGTSDMTNYSSEKEAPWHDFAATIASVVIEEGVSSIGSYAFNGCTGLEEMSIGESIIKIGDYAFSGCTGLSKINFEGAAPNIDTNAFHGVIATAYFSGDETSWTDDVKQNYGGSITWVAYGEDNIEDEVEYTYGQNVQIKLIEPWGIRANAKISTSEGVIDYSSLYDYGVYFIRKSALDRTGLTQSTITVADILNDTDARKMTKADGVTVSSGYLSAIYDNDIYTYELDDSVFVMFYFITEEGADPIYVPVRERNLKDLAQQRMNDAANFPNDLERTVYQKMTKLETDVTDYRSDFANLSAPEKQKAPTLAQYPLGAPVAVNNYSYGQNAQIKLIEPWGLKANVKVSHGGSVIDYNAVEEYGIVALADNSKVYEDVSEILRNENAYVFSSKNGDASISSGYISATYSKDIFTYQLDTDIYVFGYVKDADGYHYGPVRNRNVHALMETRMNDAVNFPNVKERTVYTDMIELFEAITAYREDYFKN